MIEEVHRHLPILCSDQFFIISATVEESQNINCFCILHGMIHDHIISNDNFSIPELLQPQVMAGLIQERIFSKLLIALLHFDQKLSGCRKIE